VTASTSGLVNLGRFESGVGERPSLDSVAETPAHLLDSFCNFYSCFPGELMAPGRSNLF